MNKVYKFALPLLATMIVFAAGQSLNAQTKPPTFFVAIYERGPGWDEKKPAMEQSGIKDHGAHIRSLGDKLVGASPLFSALKDDLHVGMIIFRAADISDAEKWL